jgi:hypothetical protein
MLLLALQFLASCAAPAPQATAMAIAATATEMDMPKHVETALPTSTPSEPYELVLKDSQGLLLNVSSVGDFVGVCDPPGTTEIWQSLYPFTKKQILVGANPGGNYFAPTYSPDGEWIAYIDSRPVIIPIWTDVYTSTPGTVSIWIMRKDGLEKRKASIDFNGLSFFDEHNYDWPLMYIERELDWSPDGGYIYFTHYKFYSEVDRRADSYILDVQTKESYLVASIPGDDKLGFVWLDDNGHFAYELNDTIRINQITDDGIDQRNAVLLPNTDTLPEKHRPIGWTSSPQGLISISYGETASYNDSLRNWVVWEYDLNKETWQKRYEVIVNDVDIGTTWGILSTNDNTLHFIDLRNWTIVGTVQIDDSIGYGYYYPELKSASGNTIVSIRDYDTNSIWGVDVLESQELFQLVDLKLLDPGEKYYILDYSWSP